MLSVPVLGWATDGLAYSLALQREVRRLGPIDLIDAHFEYPDGVGAWLAARKLGVPVVVTLRGKLVSLAAKPLRRAQIRAMLRNADGLIAVSASLAALACRIAGRDLRVDVVPNGVDAGVFGPLDRREARARLGWEANARYVLCVGHFQWLKGFDRLVRIWPAVLAAAGDARLVLVGSRRGESGFHRRIQRAVAMRGMQDCISLAGPVDPVTLNLMYNAADLSVNASRSEGWCNAIAESLAAGTPVVATDVGGNREQLCSDALGVLVPDGDLPALAAAIIDGLKRGWNRPLIADHGRARGWDQVASEVAAVFERVVGARRSHAGATMTTLSMAGGVS